MSKCLSGFDKFHFKWMNIGTREWRIIHLNNHKVRSNFNIIFNFFNDRIYMVCEKVSGEGKRHHKGEGSIKLSIEIPFPCVDHVEGSFLSEARMAQSLIVLHNFMMIGIRMWLLLRFQTRAAFPHPVEPFHGISIQSYKHILVLESFKFMFE